MSKIQPKSGGFGLVEIMVGLVIGMIASIIMFQTFAIFERQKQAVTGSADAQGNGAIAAYLLERDLKMAGWGLRFDLFGGCGSFYTYSDVRKKAIDDMATPGASLLAPVIITDGGNGPDSVAIQYYASPQQANTTINSTLLAKSLPAASSAMSLRSAVGCNVGDLAIVNQGAQCMLLQVTGVSQDGNVQYATGGGVNFNPTTDYQTAHGWPEFNCGTSGGKNPQACSLSSTSPAKVQCFGGLWQRRYSINANHELQVAGQDDTGAIVTSTVSSEIVDMQARYGVADDATAPQKVVKWLPATGDWAPANLSITRIRQIKAVRLAFLARSSTYEKPDAQGVCSATTAANIASWPKWDGVTVFAVANLPADYRCYRYKTFTVDIPLRNIVWAKT